MRRGPIRSQCGLTLVEVVVALALLSLIVLALAASLRGMSSTADRLDRRATAADGVGVSVGLLHELFERWVPVRTGLADAPWLFEARSDSLAWVASMPSRFGAVGLYAFHLGLEGAPEGPRRLVLRFAPFPTNAGGFPDWAKADSRVLVADVATMALSYGGQGLVEGWRTELASKDGMPLRLRIDLRTLAEDWPPLVFVVRTPDEAGRRATFGGKS